MVIIITAEEESSRVVTTVPVKTAENVLAVNFNIHFFALSPMAFCIVSDKLLTANKNSIKPARMESIISDIS
jgi:hypothetical protein